MAFQSKKEKQQILILVAVLTIIIGVVLYIYRDAWLPKKVINIGAGMPPPTRIVLPEITTKEIFERPDFISLKEYGTVPVRPLQRGSTEIFKEVK